MCVLNQTTAPPALQLQVVRNAACAAWHYEIMDYGTPAGAGSTNTQLQCRAYTSINVGILPARY
jgi:hypothetical protein